MAVKRMKRGTLELTAEELVHIRDLMSIALPSSGQTVSDSIAQLEDRVEAENSLWEKVHTLCSELGLPLDSDAPDFLVGMTEMPPLAVIPVSKDELFDEDALSEESGDE